MNGQRRPDVDFEPAPARPPGAPRPPPSEAGSFDPNAPDPNEVKAYLRRLLLSIAIGALVMIGATIYAWRTYGARLDERPPLPSGTPPLGTAPATTR